jgi:VanZ family protein
MSSAAKTPTLQTVTDPRGVDGHAEDAQRPKRAAVRSLRWGTAWQVGGLVLIAALVTLSLLPPIATLVARGEDKLLHGIAYAVLMIYYSGIVHPRRYVWVVVGLMLLGIAIEYLQGYVGYRAAELADVAANAIGMTVGLALGLFGLRRWARILEDRLSSREAP